MKKTTRPYTITAPTAGVRGRKPRLKTPLRAARLRLDGGAGWTQEQTATYLSSHGYPVSWHTLSNWERGRSGEPPPIVLQILADALGRELQNRRKAGKITRE